jgi:multidrug resistance efflux pump
LNKFNYIYILALALLLFFLPYLKYKLSNSDEFYGIAENPVRTINHDYPVEIIKIFKLQGEAVKAGDTLMQIRRADLESKKHNLIFEKSELDKKILREQEEHTSLLKNLRNRKTEVIKLYELRINEAERNFKPQIEVAKNVFNVQEIEQLKKSFANQIADLNDKKTLELNDLNLKTNNEILEYSARQAENITKLQKILKEQQLLESTENSLFVICPENGIIGMLELNPGDKLQAYSSLCKIYGTRPNIVTIYIGDNQLSSISIGDSVIISSLNISNYTLTGHVNALGTRITALPERLKKIPDLRAWGREVQILIPVHNELLQGEKVLVRKK